MQQHISGFLVGLLFGIGLILSGMTNPQKVQGFLDITGPWDPSLAMVMIGAISIASLAYLNANKRTHTFLGEPMSLPPKGHVDTKLIIGALIFGIGWGLVGFCPGPALVAIFLGEIKALIFVIAMLIGMVLADVLCRIKPKT